MAGAGREETERLIAVLRRFKGRFPILLVEHDMTAVFALADRISVLIYGRISPAARRTPCAPIRKSSPPISAKRWSETMLAVEKLQAAYGRRRCCST